MSPPRQSIEPLPPEWEGLLSRGDLAYLRRRLGANRTTEIRRVLLELAPESRVLFISKLREVPDQVPEAAAVLLAFATFCDTAADLACASKEGLASDPAT